MLNLFVLPLEFELGETLLTVYPTVLQDEKEIILIDCGYPDFIDKIQAELAKVSLSLEKVTKIIVTHHDHDHMGSLKAIKETYPSIEVLCSKEQVPFITGKSKSLRLIQAERLQGSLPEEEKEAGLAFQSFIASVEPMEDVIVVNPGDVLHCCGEVEIVDTKGHMPGHISLYVRSLKTLIAGDALVVEDGKLCIALPQYVLNAKDAQESIKNLLNFDIEKVICYHGGVYNKDIHNSLLAIVSQFNQ